MVVPGEVVELGGAEEMVGKDGARKVRMGAACGDGDEGHEGAGEVLDGVEEGWVEFLLLLFIFFDFSLVERRLLLGLAMVGWRWWWRSRRWCW